MSFFNITNNMTVIELQPSGGISPAGWYTEILAPYLKNNGLLIAAHFNPKESDWRAKMRDNFELLIKKKPDYNKIKMSMLSIPPSKLAEDSTADMILTFRNLHNWLKSNALKEVFKVSYQALKPGGILGVVEHRAPEIFSIEEMIKTGYVTESLAISYAQEAGFLLEKKSEINSNTRDTKNYVNGVWNLPPTLKVNNTSDRQKYIAIGESDRMTLRFIKPIK
ncbi:methyltransferase [Alphaproteobacteria bacterium]|nr:methyltransferase [Alphaproteobacteria bacterium]